MGSEPHASEHPSEPQEVLPETSQGEAPLETAQPATSSSDPPHVEGSFRIPQPGKGFSAPWNRLPQWMNRLGFKLWRNPLGTGRVLHEPMALYLYPTDPTRHLTVENSEENKSSEKYELAEETEVAPDTPPPSKDMDPQTLSYILEQVPAVKHVTFTGKGDPLLNPHIFTLVEMVATFNGAVTTLHTHGLMFQGRQEALLDSRLNHLVVQLDAHKPSAYLALTGRNPREFVSLRDEIRELIRLREERLVPPSGIRKGKKLKAPRLFIEVTMRVDVNHFRKMPDMIAYAQKLGVDGIRFENVLEPNGQKGYGTLYRHHKEVARFFDKLMRQPYEIQVTLPTLLDEDMTYHRHCQDPFMALGVDGDCNVTACSTQQLYYGRMGKIWDADFWNNDKYQWLRAVHGNSTLEVPLPCQHCPKNAAEVERVIPPAAAKEPGKDTIRRL